jgi:hypothetical protein
MSTRSLFWGSFAAAVLAAVGVYVAADHACCHRASLAAQCARGALQLGLQWCPVHQIVSRLHPAEPKKEALHGAACEAAVAPPAVEAVPAIEAPPAVEPLEVIDLTQTGVGTPPVAVDPENPEVPMSPEQKAETAPCAVEPCPAGVVVAPGDVEECEATKPAEPPLALDPTVSATMPPCDDADEAAPKKVEGAKPTCESSTAKEEPCDACWWFFEEKDACPEKQPKCDEPCDKPASDNGSAEESEPIMGGKPSDCKVDPNYHHEYPSCPYIGICFPKCDGTAPAPAEKSHKKKLKSEAPSSEAVPTPASIDEDVPKDPTIDTMEFRKSDAKKGEFKPKTW